MDVYTMKASLAAEAFPIQCLGFNSPLTLYNCLSYPPSSINAPPVMLPGYA